jgi:hypothetical protein
VDNWSFKLVRVKSKLKKPTRYKDWVESESEMKIRLVLCCEFGSILKL